MPFQREIHHRRSVRLPGYDYSRSGAYFVTICTWQRECVFGDIVDGVMRLNEAGLMVCDEWLKTPSLRSNVTLDEFVMMPNHFHAILLMDDFVDCRGTARRAPTAESFGSPVSGSLGTVIRAFKSAVTKNINALRNTPGIPVWQRNYYEHVIRDERDLNAIREYIAGNPARWADVL